MGSTVAQQEEIWRLRGRVGELEEEVRQLRDLLAPTVYAESPVQAVHLTKTEAKMFAHFVARDMVTRESAMVALHGLAYEVNPKMLDVYVCKLRAKLGGAGLVIDTHWGEGFSLRDRHKWAAIHRDSDNESAVAC